MSLMLDFNTDREGLTPERRLSGTCGGVGASLEVREGSQVRATQAIEGLTMSEKILYCELFVSMVLETM